MPHAAHSRRISYWKLWKLVTQKYSTWSEFESETQSGIESETESGTEYEIEWLPKILVCRLQFAELLFEDCSWFVAAKNVSFNSWNVVQNEK